MNKKSSGNSCGVVMLIRSVLFFARAAFSAESEPFPLARPVSPAKDGIDENRNLHG